MKIETGTEELLCEVDLVAVPGCGHTHQFKKAAETYRNLAAERIGMRQQAIGVDMKDHLIWL